MSLPNGYKRLEYIQSSGTQYVNTKFVPNQDTRVLAEMYCPLNSGSFCGVLDSTNTRYGVYVGAAYRNDYNTSLINGLSTNLTEKFVLDKNKNVQTVNGVSATAPYAQFSITQTLYLFAYNANGSANYFGSGIKLYSCQIYDNGEAVRDFIPCQNASGAVGLWDAVNEEFYGNAGTGTFTAGPEVIPDPPSATSGLQQVLTVGLTWGAVDGATGYRIYRDGNLVGDTETPEFSDYGVDQNSTFVYMVTAYNDGGESPGTSVTVYTKTGYFIYKPYIETANFL